MKSFYVDIRVNGGWKCVEVFECYTYKEALAKAEVYGAEYNIPVEGIRVSTDESERRSILCAE